MLRVLLLGALLPVAANLPAQGCPTELQTLFDTNNGGSVGGAVYFDLTVTNQVTITALCVNTSVAFGLPIGVTVYTNSSVASYAGNEADPNWTQVGVDDGNGVSAGIDMPSGLTLQAPLVLAPGTYPMALVGSGTGGTLNHRYTSGNGSNQAYADASLSISLGSASNIPFSFAFTPRVWNGSIKYVASDALLADFTGAFTSCGAAPLMATFTDQSCTTDAGGITGWLWDFGDGNTSTMQNPTHVYTAGGLFTVSLTVTDASHPPSTRTRVDYVTVAWPNDECASAIEVFVGMNGPYDNLCATDSMPAMPCGGTASSDVWFRYLHFGWDAPMEANTCGGSTYDSKIEVLAGDCGSLTSIACNDDACSGQAAVSWQATMGTTYYIRVGGVDGARGVLDLQLRVTGRAAQISPGCGGQADLMVSSDAASGLPEIGAGIMFELVNPQGLPAIWFDATLPTPGYPFQVPGCPVGCMLAVDFDISVPGVSPFTLNIPNDPIFCGACFNVQGADVGAGVGPCDLGGVGFNLTSAHEILVGC